jgi:hypothetical protein
VNRELSADPTPAPSSTAPSTTRSRAASRCTCERGVAVRGDSAGMRLAMERARRSTPSRTTVPARRAAAMSRCSGFVSWSSGTTRSGRSPESAGRLAPAALCRFCRAPRRKALRGAASGPGFRAGTAVAPLEGMADASPSEKVVSIQKAAAARAYAP